MSTEAVEIAIGFNAHVLNGPLASAQSALLTQLKAAVAETRNKGVGSLFRKLLSRPVSKSDTHTLLVAKLGQA